MTGSKLRGRNAEAKTVAGRGAREVEHKLREEGGGVDRQVARGWMRLAGGDQNEGRADNVPRVDQTQKAAVERNASSRVFGHSSEKRPASTNSALVFGAAPASAGLGLACPDATSKAFSRWADYANYAYVPDGGFEAGAAGWTLASGAKVVAGNEPLYIHSSSDRYALVLPKGSSATSPPMCIGLLSTKMRFVVTGPVGSKVKVQIIYRGLLSSVLGILDGGTVSTNGTWQPSPSIGMLGGLLPLLTRSVQFRLVATSGTPKVDDVYLDPMKSG